MINFEYVEGKEEQGLKRYAEQGHAGAVCNLMPLQLRTKLHTKLPTHHNPLHYMSAGMSQVANAHHIIKLPS
jgi:hypothetical protein